MARPRLVYSLMIVIVIAHLCSCARYVKYTEYYLESEKICHILNEKRQLDIRNGIAAIVSVKHMFDRWIVKSDRNCTFVFKAEKGEGLFVVIHKMFLRTDGRNGCLDYIRFKKSDGHYTNKTCGEIDRSHIFYPVSDSSVSSDINTEKYDKFAEYDPIRKYMLFEAKVKVETEIVISKEQVPKGESLDLTIIYTPYRSCNNVDFDQYAPVGHNICIRKEYVCDKMINCPSDVCSDEEQCMYADQAKEDTTTKVTVGAVTTMILCFIIFVMCLWICKKSRKLCWSSDCAGPNVCSRPTSLSQDADAVPNSNRAVPTAPMLEVAVSSPVVDKDLPPSYDSLFPEQSNPART